MLLKASKTSSVQVTRNHSAMKKKARIERKKSKHLHSLNLLATKPACSEARTAESLAIRTHNNSEHLVSKSRSWVTKSHPISKMKKSLVSSSSQARLKHCGWIHVHFSQLANSRRRTMILWRNRAFSSRIKIWTTVRTEVSPHSSGRT